MSHVIFKPPVPSALRPAAPPTASEPGPAPDDGVGDSARNANKPSPPPASTPTEKRRRWWGWLRFAGAPASDWQGEHLRLIDEMVLNLP
jgi:hypothetical protein